MAEVYKIDIKDTGDEKKIVFSGSLIINYIEKIYDEIKETINEMKPLSIEISNPDNIDITFVQLIVSIKKTYSKAGVSLNVDAELKDDIIQLLDNSGLKNELNN